MEIIYLPKILDMVAATPLRDNFLIKEGFSVLVNAENVQKLGAQCLQVLLSAKNAWEFNEYDFIVDKPSNEFIEFLSFMGIVIDDLSYLKQDIHKKV